MRVKTGGQYKVGVTRVKSGGTYKTGNPLVKSGGQYKADQTKRWVYNFDGIDDRGVLAFRAINPDGDNTFEFWKPSNPNCTIIAQGIASNGAAREFQIWQGASRELNLVYGGVNTNAICTVAQGYTDGSKYFLTLEGTTATLAKDTPQNIIRTTTFTRGTAREPSASTLIGCRGNDGSFTGFAQGLQYDVKINGILWPMSERNQTIQQSVPSGNNMTLFNTTSDRWQEVLV